LIVNVVLATDIVDKELKTLRNARWDKAFHQNDQTKGQVVQSGSPYNDDATNRKATIVIEHIIQASDIAHTMQHWHIYRKWNERFFEENMVAYQSGRAPKDPSCWKKNDVAKMRQAGTAPATGTTIYCLTSLWCNVIYKLLVLCRYYQQKQIFTLNHS